LATRDESPTFSKRTEKIIYGVLSPGNVKDGSQQANKNQYKIKSYYESERKLAIKPFPL